jgi:ribonucleotide monophosphatase NagD (HAD superfamily)
MEKKMNYLIDMDGVLVQGKKMIPAQMHLSSP